MGDEVSGLNTGVGSGDDVGTVSVLVSAGDMWAGW